MKFVIATNNKKKLKELSAILETLGIDALSLKEAGVETDVEETGTTFAENARLKAENAMKITGLPAVADDSGLEVFALNGEPGIYSARYGGDLPDDEARYTYLLSNMKGIEDRAARFVSTICCSFPNGDEILVEGEIRGEILEIAIGDGGFGYDPVFYLPDEECTMAQLSSERKNEISHRANALAKFKEELIKRM